MHDKKAQIMQDKQDADDIDLASSECASPVLFVPNSDVTMRYFVHYLFLNDTTLGKMNPFL